ncbi:MAG TPA: hypothetical protein VFK13_04125 [Gemmatimonadaceae bacterium]|nr:hypothetical protein [Gemmatimonadaceae bacterium]
MRYAALFPVALLAAPTLALAQAVIDQGSFTITHDGARVGREEFTIRRQPAPGGGPAIIARARVTLDGKRLTPALRASAAGEPDAYEIEVRSGLDVAERLRLDAGRGRFSARLRTPDGESAREYMVADGALILDDDVFHQYYFVAQRPENSSIPVVIPRRNTQVTMRVASGGTERVVIGGSALQARVIVLTAPGGDVRRIWVDDAGRVLKVALEGRGIVATRDEPPQ